MKKINTFALILVSTLLTTSCGDNTTNNPPVVTPIAPVEEVVVLPPSSNIISIEEADSLYVNYGNDRASLIEKSMNTKYKLATSYESSRFVTADYETLKKYIAYIDQESKKAGVTPTGLRIYFGATDGKGKTPGRETTYFNPVMKFKGIEGDIAYAIATDATGKSTAVTVGSVLDDKKTKSNTGTNRSLQGGGIQSLAGDEVTWPPPPKANDPNDYHKQ